MIFRNILLFLFTFGLLTELRIFSGDQVLIPVFISFIIGFFFILKHLPKFFHYDLRYFYYVVLFFLISIFFGPDKLDSLFLKERFLGFVQIFTSLVISIAIYFELKRFELKKLSSFFFYLFLFILFGSLIEVISPLKYIIDAFMSPLFPEGNYYFDVQRDINLYSYYRPKFFTSEPSHLGKFISMVIFMWRLSTNHSKKNILFVLFLTISFFVIRSPLILFMFPVFFLILLLLENNYYHKLNLENFILSLLIFLIALIGSINLLQERFESISSGTDRSLNQRLIIPLFVTSEVLAEYPTFGVGIAGKEVIEIIVLNKFLEIDPNFKPRSIKELLDKNHTTSLQYFIYFGLIGTLILGFLLKFLISSLGTKSWLFIFLTFFILGFTHGKLTGLNTWTYFFTSILILQKRNL